ncbi:MAG TPA: DUF624 domain-containing protein [Chloroflexia bacterium]|nr:DUF624 domain-containing protein [Chloroflexia bacterium]
MPARARRAGPVRLAFTHAVQDWWYGLIPFAVLNLVWLGCVATVVAGPPATAALFVVARDAAIGQGAEPSTFFYALRRYFWRSWGLGLVSAAGTFLFVFDLYYYADRLAGTGIAFNVGVFFLVYVLLVWLEFLLMAWPLLVNHPAMGLRHVLRNAAIVTLRTPGANFGLAAIVVLLTLFSIWFSPFVGLGLGALVALLAQHYLHIQAPVLANFPPRPGEGPLDE